ncbi:hypothetical protein HMPREF1317_1589 [Schaalia georgiae F0490]|uniref:Uncharacterized protein n=1 Tax=Schaalia georgiae F0490 TaxID=1125717 RepID=J1GTT7_9ACTO|nr:hypothetical protein HMPREF1317_1589 [Schaalia georgiae F0490]
MAGSVHAALIRLRSSCSPERPAFLGALPWLPPYYPRLYL